MAFAVLLCSCNKKTDDSSQVIDNSGKVSMKLSDTTISIGEQSFSLPLSVSEMTGDMRLKNIKRVSENEKCVRYEAELYFGDAFFGMATIADESFSDVNSGKIVSLSEDSVISGCAAGDFSLGEMRYGKHIDEIEAKYGKAMHYNLATSQDAYFFDDGMVMLIYAGNLLINLSVTLYYPDEAPPMQ